MEESREHMALMAQAGHTEYLTPLWASVEGLCGRIMREYTKRLKLPNWVDADDVIQCAYFGFLDAVKAYDPYKGFAFTSYLSLHLRKAAVRRSGARQRPYTEVSGDAYLTEDESLVLWDALADDRASDAFEAVELSDAQEKVRAAMLRLSAKQQHILELHFWHEVTFTDIAKTEGVSLSYVSAQYRAALNRLRRARELRGLYEEYKRHIDGREWQTRFMFSQSAEYSAVRREIAREAAQRYLSYGKRQAMLKTAYDRFGAGIQSRAYNDE